MEPWRVVGASASGQSHDVQGVPCQDAHAYRVLDDGTLLVAVADGAGSAVRAQEGAQNAVLCALAWLADSLAMDAPDDADAWRALMADTFAVTREVMAAIARDDGMPLREYSATLMCVVVTDCWLVVGQIGDGIVVMEDRGELTVAVRPQRGEYANESAFLTMSALSDHVAIEVTGRPPDAVAVTTDGLLRLATKMPDVTPYGPFFAPLFAFTAGADDLAQAEAALGSFLSSARVRARTDDDTTLVLAVRDTWEPIPAALPPVAAESLNGHRPAGEVKEFADSPTDDNVIVSEGEGEDRA
ncbi:MAG: PP2C family serine/threonine-protein phosphatase [Anaerolineae bacterium]